MTLSRKFAPIALLLATPLAAAGAPGIPGSANPAAVEGGNYTVEPYHTRVQFTVNHMGFTEWYGDFTSVSGSLTLDPKRPAANRVDITIPTASVSTTNAKLDDELKSPDWFDAAQYPTIHFVATRVTRTGPARAILAGNLTFHGQTRPVVLAASFVGAGKNPMSGAYTVGFNATAHLRRSDFGVSKYAPMIGDAVDLRISAAFERQH